MNKKALILGIGLSVALLGACDKQETKGDIVEESSTKTSTTMSDGEEVTKEEYSLKDDGFFKDIVSGKEDPKVKTEFEYATSWSDKEWENVDFEINRVKVVEVEHFKDDTGKEYKGLLSLRFTLANDGKEEVSIRPSDATVILNDGTEIKATHFADYWDDIFAKDKKKDGYVHFVFDEVGELDQIKEIHMTFAGHDKDHLEDKASHEYDVKLPLELAK